MLKSYYICDSRVQEKTDGSGNVLVCVSPEEGERQELVERYRIDQHTLQSALDPDEISRLEFEPDHIAMIFKRPKNYSAEDQLVFKVSSMGMFWFQDRLILVIPEETPLFDGKRFNRVATLHDLVLKLIDTTTLHYLSHLKTINMIYESLEHKINRAMENKYLLDLFSLEKGMVYYQNAIHSNGVVMDKLKAMAARIGFSPENLELLDDLIIENQQCYKQAEISSNIFASLMDARVSIVNNNLNVLIKVLNIVTIAIMVPTFVVSTFSMNVKIPMAQHPYAFWIIMGLSGISLAVFMIIWKLFNRNR